MLLFPWRHFNGYRLQMMFSPYMAVSLWLMATVWWRRLKSAITCCSCIENILGSHKLMAVFRTLTLPFLLRLILCCCNLQHHQFWFFFFYIRVWVLFHIDYSPMFVISRSRLLPPVFVLHCPWLAQLVAYLPTLKLPYSCSAYPALFMSHVIPSEQFCWNETFIGNSLYSLKKNALLNKS